MNMQDSMPGNNQNKSTVSEHVKAMALIHLVGMLFGGWGAIGVLIYWLIYKDKFVAQDTAVFNDVINFNVSFLIYLVACIPLCFILIGFLGIAVFSILYFVFVIISTIKLLGGEAYRFPMTIQLLK